MRVGTVLRMWMAAAIAVGSVAVVPAQSVGAAGEPLSGRVTDTAGNPLAGVQVMLTGPGGNSAMTDANGDYALFVADGTYQLSFQKSGYRGEVYDEVEYGTFGPPPTGTPVTVSAAAPQVIDESLMRLPQLTGQVVDRQGNPVAAGVNGSLVPFGASGSGSSAPGTGTFAIDLPQSGTYRLSAFASGFLTTYAPSTLNQNAAGTWTVGYDQTIAVGQLTLLRGGTITGTVTDANGPLPGAQVSANPNPPLPYPAFGQVTTLPDGSYTISGLPEGSYQVNFSAAGRIGEVYDNLPQMNPGHTPVVVVEGQATPGIDAQLSAGATVTGHVVDRFGNPVVGAGVQAIGQTGGFGGPSGSAITGPVGEYTITGLPAGNYLLTAGTTGLAQAFVSGAGAPTLADVLALANDTTTTADFTLQPLGTITGQVLQPDGQPLAGAPVNALVVQTPGIAWFPMYLNTLQRSTTADANGVYTLTGMAPGSFRVSASAVQQNDPLLFEYYQDQRSEAAANPVVVTPGGTTANIDFQLEVGGVITGRVTDGAGQPVVGNFVVAMGPNGEFGGGASTDANGVYTLRGIAPGSYSLGAQPFGDAPQTYHPATDDRLQATYITVGLGQTVTGIDIQMRAAARMEATVLDPAGNPIPVTGGPYAFWGVGFCVDPGVPVATFSQCSGGSLGGASTATKPADGQWVGTGIPSGTYNVAAFVAFPIAISGSSQITLVAGDTATCTFQVNGPASCTVTHGTPNPDNDGVPEATEDGVAPDGDGNGDTVPDSQQSNVTSLPSPVSGGGYVTVAAPAGLELSSVTVVDPATVTATPPPGATVDNGVIAYTLEGVTPGATVDIDVFLTTPTAATGYAKVQAGQWVPLPGTAFTKLSNTHFVLHLTDGGVGDEDGLANGTIVDPGAPITLDTTPPTIVCPATPTFLLNASGAVVTADVTDEGAGVAVGTASAGAVTTSLGVQSVAITAADLAGNAATVPCDYQVGVRIKRFEVEDDRTVEAGETLKVTWRTVDADGRPVALPSTISLTTAPTTCGADPVATGPSTAATLTNQGVKYKGDGYWEAKWRTDRAWRGCRQLTVTVVGDAEVARFRFVRD